MPVYVDASLHPYGRMVMCHMAADTIGELHAMADEIGLKRRWLQDANRRPHYDICKQMRAEAVKAGAVEINSKEMVLLFHRLQAGQAT